MSPLEIKIALHYYCCLNPYSGPEAGTLAHTKAIQKLMSAGMLRAVGDDYGKTDGLEVYVSALMAIPMPVRAWQMPPFELPDIRLPD